jgi:tetratricopeptide (TPR) repeat protein
LQKKTQHTSESSSQKPFQEAIDAYNNALKELIPLRVLPYGESCALRCLANQIQCLIKLGEFEKAIGVTRYALTVPCSAHETHLAQKVHARCAVALESIGQFEAALHALDRAISYDPTDTSYDDHRERLIEALNSSSEKLVAVAPRPVELTIEDVSRTITAILQTKAEPKAILPILNAMAERSVFIDRRDKNSNNIMWAVCRAAIMRASTVGENPDDIYPVLEFLLMHGARADQRYFGTDKENYQTPLMIMALCGAVDCARLLMRFGASVATCDTNGWTALHVACAPNSPRKQGTAKGEDSHNDEMVELLLEAKANVHIQNSAGLTPLHCACHGGDVPSAALLILAGSKLNARSANGFSAMVWALIGSEGNDTCEMVQLLLNSCAPLTLEQLTEEPTPEGEEKPEETEEQKAEKVEKLGKFNEYKAASLVEFQEDMKCFRLAHLIVQLKIHLREYLLGYQKTAKEKMGIDDAKPAPHLIQKKLADAMGRYTRVVMDAGGAPDIKGKYLATVDGNIYEKIVSVLFDNSIPESLFKKWTPVDNPQQAVMSATPLERARLQIIMTSVTGPVEGEAMLSRSMQDDFMYCGKYPDFRMFIREPLVSVFSTCIPNDAALTAIAGAGKGVFLMNTGADYWMKLLEEKEKEESSPLDILQVRLTETPNPPPYFESKSAVAVVENLADFGDRTLITLWPMSSMVSVSSKEEIERDMQVITTFTGSKMVIIGDVDFTPPGAPTMAMDFVKNGFECVETIPLKNWPTYNYSVTIWNKI